MFPEYPEPDEDPSYRVLKAEATNLALAENSVDLVVTSPPYWQKRDYGVDGQIGQEPTVEDYASTIGDVLDELDRVLCPHGSVFLNVGDTYEENSLQGVPARVAAEARSRGWIVRNRFTWLKTGGMPNPVENRVAPRTEPVFHLSRDTDYYYDKFGYSEIYGNGSDPGDVWEIDYDRNLNGHVAPFPLELPLRAIRVACPRAVGPAGPVERELSRSLEPDTSRQQGQRAKELFEESDLTEDHIRAVQARGLGDSGKDSQIQNGTGRNTDEIERLAEEADDVFGSYSREFLNARYETVGWTETEGRTRPGVVLDPFAGTGTTVHAARQVGVSAIASDLDLEHYDSTAVEPPSTDEDEGKKQVRLDEL